jgi:transposase-like protein
MKKDKNNDINTDVLDELIKDYKNPEDLIGEDGLLKQLTKALIERAMHAEMTHQLGYLPQLKKKIVLIENLFQ